MTVVADAWWLYARKLRNLARQPIWIFIILVQPLIWLLLFSQLFGRVTDLPGFERADSYTQFLTPGIVVMTAFFSSLWSGMGMIQDIDRGVVERLLVTPARRPAVVIADVLVSASTAIVQALIVLGIGSAMGARVDEGVLGWLALLAACALVAACFAGLSSAIALLARREETMIAVANFIGLPLTFVSTTLIAGDSMPDWMEWAARFNPVDWAVRAAREVTLGGAEWLHVLGWLGLLLGLSAVTCAFATWAFRAYRRTI